MATQLARSTGARVKHQQELGGTRLIFDALRVGDVEGGELESADLGEMAGITAVVAPDNEHDVDALVAQCQDARMGGDFAEADRIRDELAAEGISIEDTPDGPRWRRG